MPTFSVTIEETIHYYLTVEAESASAAQELVEQRMQEPTWEDPSDSEVRGQQVWSVTETSTCVNCQRSLVREKDDPWFHSGSGEERCSPDRDDFAVPADDLLV